MHCELPGRQVDASDLVVGVIRLDRAPLLEGDLPEEGIADAHDRSALDLGADPLGVDDGAGIYDDIGSRNRDAPVGFYLNLDDGRDVTEKTPVDCDTAALSLSQRLTPPRLLGCELKHVRYRATSIG